MLTCSSVSRLLWPWMITDYPAYKRGRSWSQQDNLQQASSRGKCSSSASASSPAFCRKKMPYRDLLLLDWLQLPAALLLLFFLRVQGNVHADQPEADNHKQASAPAQTSTESLIVSGCLPKLATAQQQRVIVVCCLPSSDGDDSHVLSPLSSTDRRK